MKNLKKTLTVLTASMAVLSLVGCSSKNNNTAKVDDVEIIESEDNQIANPWSEVKTIDEAKNIVGFDFAVPDSIDGNSISLIQVMDDEEIEVRYDDVILRKSKGNEDNSGDYNNYDVVKNVDGVTLKGDGNNYNLASWVNGDYAYSITSSGGLSLDTISELVDFLD